MSYTANNKRYTLYGGYLINFITMPEQINQDQLLQEEENRRKVRKEKLKNYILFAAFGISILFSLVGPSIFWKMGLVLALTVITIGFLFPIYIRTKRTENEELDIDSFVKRVFKSETFLHAFETSLPKGEDDETYGFDYIPYIIDSIEIRRERFKESSERFLNMMISLGALFIVVVMIFGYVLLNDDSVGIRNNLKEINSELIRLNDNLLFQNPDISQNPEFQKCCLPSYSKIINGNYSLSENNKSTFEKIKKDLSSSFRTGNVYLISDSIKIKMTKLKEVKDGDKMLIDDLNEFNSEYESFWNSKNGTFYKLQSEINRFDNSIDALKAELNLEKNRIAEILKRLILSIVVVSFFIAVLRYIIKLYNSHHNQMIQAEHEEVLIKKFYVLVKTVGESKEERIQIIKNFMSSDSLVSDEVNTALNQEEKKFLKGFFEKIIEKF